MVLLPLIAPPGWNNRPVWFTFMIVFPILVLHHLVCQEESSTGSKLVPFNFSKVPLPRIGAEPRLWFELSGAGDSFVGDFKIRHLLENCDAQVNLLQQDIPSAPYSDPAMLGSVSDSAKFLPWPEGSWVVEYRLLPPIGSCGLFFVLKTNGRHRLVIDARRSTCHFGDPPNVSLATGFALSDVDGSESHEPVFISTIDVKYLFGIIKWQMNCVLMLGCLLSR